MNFTKNPDAKYPEDSISRRPPDSITCWYLAILISRRLNGTEIIALTQRLLFRRFYWNPLNSFGGFSTQGMTRDLGESFIHSFIHSFELEVSSDYYFGIDISNLCPLFLDGKPIEWVGEWKYLGVVLTYTF